MSKYTESIVEEACIQYFKDIGYDYVLGTDISHDSASPERRSYSDVILEGRLHSSLCRINPHIPAQAIDDAVKQIVRTDSPTIVINNRYFHKLVTDGVDVQFRNKEGRDVTDKVWIFDFNDPDKNDWLVVNQFTVVENHVNRRPDVVVFVNGIPIGVIELKNGADANATVKCHGRRENVAV